MSKKRNKKYNPNKRLDMLRLKPSDFNGLVLAWDSTDPFGNGPGSVLNSVMSHTNPFINRIVNLKFGGKSKEISEPPFFWRVSVVTVFKYPNKVEQESSFEFVTPEAVPIPSISKLCAEQIEDSMREGNTDHFSHCHFRCECLGDKPKVLTIEQQIKKELAA